MLEALRISLLGLSSLVLKNHRPKKKRKKKKSKESIVFLRTHMKQALEIPYRKSVFLSCSTGLPNQSQLSFDQHLRQNKTKKKPNKEHSKLNL